jgi:hypothetical protein
MSQPQLPKSRRKLLKSIAIGGGAIAVAKTLPESWTKPVIDSVILPAHGVASVADTYSGVMWLSEISGEETHSNVITAEVCVVGNTALYPFPDDGSYAAKAVIYNSGVASTTAWSSNLTFGEDETLDNRCGDGSVLLTSINVGSPDGSSIPVILTFNIDGGSQVHQGTTNLPIGGSCPTEACYCFLASTEVLLADGNTKFIEMLTPGDLLASYDFTTNRVVHSPVDKLHMGDSKSYLDIDGLYVTDTHPFAIGNDDWLVAGKLQPKQKLVTLDGPVLIDNIKRVHQPTPIFNMSVANTQNYYVKYNEQFVLVHNK